MCCLVWQALLMISSFSKNPFKAQWPLEDLYENRSSIKQHEKNLTNVISEFEILNTCPISTEGNKYYELKFSMIKHINWFKSSSAKSSSQHLHWLFCKAMDPYTPWAAALYSEPENSLGQIGKKLRLDEVLVECRKKVSSTSQLIRRCLDQLTSYEIQ